MRGRATVRWHSPRILLFVTAIVLHNIPEGMAVGVSAGAGLDEANGLALGIALQDVPEGLVVALVLAGVGMSRFKAMLVGAASGLVEPLFAVLCAWLVGLSALLLPWGWPPRRERCSSWSPTRSFPSPTARDMPPRLRWAWCSVSA